MSEWTDWRWCGLCCERVESDDVYQCGQHECPMNAPIDTGDELHQILGGALALPRPASNGEAK